MITTSCTPSPEICARDGRRSRVRASGELSGIDYVEVYRDGVTLCVHFFGAQPADLTSDHIVIEGGARIRNLAVVETTLHEHEDGDVCLMVTLDRTGDFSRYCVCVIDPVHRESRCSFEAIPATRRSVPKGIDPRYACAPFFFRTDCASNVDCASDDCPAAPAERLPPIDYLARDYDTFRRLILDRLAQTMPAWRERHASDLGITIAEVFAYVADHFSYQLDSIAMEAFLRTARRRISVRRHARLVDYWMHEGRNARAWITIDAEGDLEGVRVADLRFAALTDSGGRRGGIIGPTDVLGEPPALLVAEAAMHDGPAQNLTGLSLQLAAMKRTVSDREQLERLVECEQVLADTTLQTRTLMLELAPPGLHESGLIEALRWLGERVANQQRLLVTVEDDGNPKPLEDQVTVLLFQTVRELLQNVVKHARSKRAAVRCSVANDQLMIDVVDPGVGFEVHSINRLPTRQGGFGLFNIRERLKLMGGHVDIHSVVGEGTTVRIRVPLKSQHGLFDEALRA